MDNITVREYFCDNLSAGGYNSEFYKCPNGCKEGACIGQICKDTCSSLGKQCGTWTICNVSTNCGTCIAPQICSNGQCVGSNTTLCGDGICGSGETCTNCPKDCGACVNQTYTCTDSDGGINYNVKGITTEYLGSNITATGTDFCSNSTLTEYYCSSSRLAKTTYTCSGNATCIGGACI